MGVSSFNGSVSSVGFNYKTSKASNNITSFKVDTSKAHTFNYVVKELKNDVKTVEESANTQDFEDILTSVACTAVVNYTSVRSGMLKFGEKIFDGVINLRVGADSLILRLFGQEEAAAQLEQAGMDFIAIDWVGEANKAFYEGTGVGRFVNENSYMKYDSETAQKVQTVSEKATFVVAATAITVGTGGAGGVVATGAMGALYGMGESAEQHYQAEDRGEYWSLKNAGDIALDSAIKAGEAIAAGQMGATALNAAGTLGEVGIGGIKNAVVSSVKNLNKDAMLNTVKKDLGKIAKHAAVQTLKDKDFYLDTAGTIAGDVKTGIQTGEWDVGHMVLSTAASYGTNYLGNLAGGFAEGVSFNNAMDNLIDAYHDGNQAAIDKYNNFFKNFRDHADGHVYNVADYADKMAKEIGDINVSETVFGAYTHDIGMKGGYINDVKGKWLKKGTVTSIDDIKLRDINKEGEAFREFLYDQDGFKEFVGGKNFDDVTPDEFNSWLSSHEIDTKKAEKWLSMQRSLMTRGNHPLNSAVSILDGDFVPAGVDKDTVAVLAMSHSKSTSGIQYMDDPKQWNDCIDRLEATVKQYNLDNGTNISFDADKMRKMIDDPDQFTRLQNEAFAIRDGDAMSDVFLDSNGNTIMQDGGYSTLKFNELRGDNYDLPVGTKENELKTFEDTLYNGDGSLREAVTNNTSKKIHAGERNVNFDSHYNGGNYTLEITLNQPNEVPHSTFGAIEERLGEVKTYTNLDSRDIEIVLPKEAENKSLHKWYTEKLDKHLAELDTDAKLDCDKGIISKETYEKQKDFFENHVKFVFR